VDARIAVFLKEHRIPQVELAELLGLDQGSVSRRISGVTEWRLAEVRLVLEHLSGRLGRPVTFDEAFGPAAPDLVAPDSDPSAA
jgi:transcriptional regulator with XRE-family HTH domain